MLTQLAARGAGQAGMFSFPGGWEWMVILLFVLLVFGPKRLPQLSRAIGRSIRDFKRGLNDIKDDIEKEEADEDEGRPTIQHTAQPPKNSEPRTPMSGTDEKND
jgi:sec-independent protein translocase protein TatA